MKIRKRCRFLAFLYYELLILGVFTSLVHWFDAGDVYSYGRFVFFMPILFYRHFYQKEKREERKVASCHVGALVLAGLFMMPGTILEAADDSFWLCSIFYLAAIVVGFAGEYWRGQYLVVGCNPSVSKETKRRMLRDFLRFCFYLWRQDINRSGILKRIQSKRLPWRKQKRRKSRQRDRKASPERLWYGSSRKSKRVISGLHYCGILY